MVNRLDAHSDHMYYEDKDAMYGDEMPLRQSLNGTWKINYAVNIEASDRDFIKKTGTPHYMMILRFPDIWSCRDLADASISTQCIRGKVRRI